MTPVQKLKEDWLNYLELSGKRASRTIQNYNQILEKFINWSSITFPEEINLDLIKNYQIYLNRKIFRGRNLTLTTQTHQLIVLKNFLNYLQTKKDLNVLSPKEIKLQKVQKQRLPNLTRKEIINILDEVKKAKKNLRNLRDNAILEMLFYSGIKVSELVSLNRENINFEKNEIWVKNNKNKIRFIFIHKNLKKSLFRYLAERKDQDPSLFIRSVKKFETNLRLSVRQVERIVSYWAKKTGTSKKVTPNSFRQFFITNLLRKGEDLKKVQVLAGHASIFSTQVYKHLTNPLLKKIQEK